MKSFARIRHVDTSFIFLLKKVKLFKEKIFFLKNSITLYKYVSFFLFNGYVRFYTYLQCL